MKDDRFDKMDEKRESKSWDFRELEDGEEQRERLRQKRKEDVRHEKDQHENDQQEEAGDKEELVVSDSGEDGQTVMEEEEDTINREV